MRVICIIQARLSSARLPGKCLMDLCGKPLIDHVIARAKAIKGIDSVVLNVPAQDKALFREGMTYFVKDQEQDVLRSYLSVAEQEQADVVVRITGDCPLLCPDLAERVLLLYRKLKDPAVYCANDTLRSGFPDGTDVEVFSMQMLRMAEVKAPFTSDREHVTPWIRMACPNYGILNPFHIPGSVLPKWSVDTEEDLIRVRKILEQEPQDYSYHETLRAWYDAGRP